MIPAVAKGFVIASVLFRFRGLAPQSDTADHYSLGARNKSIPPAAPPGKAEERRQVDGDERAGAVRVLEH